MSSQGGGALTEEAKSAHRPMNFFKGANTCGSAPLRAGMRSAKKRGVLPTPMDTAKC